MDPVNQSSAFAVRDAGGNGWRSPQQSLFHDDPTPAVVWPRWGSWDHEGAYCAGERPIKHAPYRLLPTPCAMVPNDNERAETWLARAESLKAKHNNGNGAGMPLSIAVQLLTRQRPRAPLPKRRLPKVGVGQLALI